MPARAFKGVIALVSRASWGHLWHMVVRKTTGVFRRLAVAAMLLLVASVDAANQRGEVRERRAYAAEDYAMLYARLGEQLERYTIDPRYELEADPIELEPYIVDGDDTLLIAALRRYLDLGPISIRQRVAELAPVMARQAQFSGRQSDVFFLAPSPGRPADAGATVPVNFEDIIAIQRSVTKAVRSVLPKR